MIESIAVVTIVAIVVAGAGVWWYGRYTRGQRIAAIIARKKGSSVLVAPASLVEGSDHIPVALSLEDGRVAYANQDLDASIDLPQIDEVEYGSDLVTGAPAKGSVLRLRSHGRVTEFVLDAAMAERWSQHLPPHRLGEAGSVQMV